MVGIGEEHERQLVLLAKALQSLQRVGAHANHHAIGLLDLVGFVTESLGVARSTASSGLRVEVEDDHLPFELREPDLFSHIGEQLKVRRDLTDSWH